MEVISGRRFSSELNPLAEPFVPVAYRAVEDYSPEWWQLVESCSWFRDYWLKHCFLDPELTDIYDDESELPDDFDSLLGLVPSLQEGEKRSGEEMVIWGKDGKWRRSRAEAPRVFEKAPKFVNVRISPRMIQQPK